MAVLLEVKDLRVHFHNARQDRFAVNGISFTMNEGEILGLVGESGSGKTVTAMCVSGLLPRNRAELSGSISLCGKNLIQCTEKELQKIQGKDLSVVFQEPMTSMNPVLTIGRQVEESLRVHRSADRKERKRQALKALEMVEIPDPELSYKKYPHQMSGGQLQRAMIAAAIIHSPKLLLADEPTTALDVTIQSQILDLLVKLNRETGMGILFISHDLHVVRKICDRVAVMERGELVEIGDTETVYRNPTHPYTKKLIAAIPHREEGAKREGGRI